MKQLGSTIECYRGEAFTLRREFVDTDGAPITLPSSMRNPFLRFTVKSNTYKIDGEYVKNYWYDLSNYNRVDYAELGPPKIDILYPTTTTLYQTNSPDVTVDNQSGETVFTINEAINNLYISTTDATRKNFDRLSFTLKNTIPSGGSGVLWLIDSDTEVTLEERPFEFDSEQEFTFDFRLKTHSKRLYIRIIFTETKNTGTVTISDVTGNYITNILYYNITEDGREYYTVNYMGVGTEWAYKFELVRKFINADTKKWIGQIYQYEIALCSGELMTDWLTNVFKSLYPGVNAPTANAELAHYICKKRPDLLDSVNVNEPLVSYQTNKVLQGPSKLIVKEN